MGGQEHAFRTGVDVIVATPGRLLDHFRFPARLHGLEVLVLDEADRMLDMGFLPDVRRVLRHLPGRRQTLFFSATVPPPIATLAREMLRDPATINLERRAAPAVGITHAAYPVPAPLKPAPLLELLKSGEMTVEARTVAVPLIPAGAARRIDAPDPGHCTLRRRREPLARSSRRARTAGPRILPHLSGSPGPTPVGLREKARVARTRRGTPRLPGRSGSRSRDFAGRRVPADTRGAGVGPRPGVIGRGGRMGRRRL